MGGINMKKLLFAIFIFVICFIFSPGLFLNLPPKGYPEDESNGVVFSWKTNLYSMIVHAVVIAIVVYIFLIWPKLQKLLGFKIEFL